MSIRVLKGEDLVRELAVMLSGDFTESSLKMAQDLLKSWEERWDTELKEQAQ